MKAINSITIASVCAIVGLLVLPLSNNIINGYESSSSYIFEKSEIENIECDMIHEDNNVCSRKLKKPVDYNNSSKDDIFYMMLNSIDYFDKVSGKILSKSYNSDYISIIDFQTELSSTKAYSACRYVDEIAYSKTSSIDFESIKPDCLQYCDGNNFVIVYPKEESFEYANYSIKSLNNSIPIPNSERLSSIDGVPVYAYRCDPTNVDMSNKCLFPQELTFGYLQDKNIWNVVDIVDYKNTKCYLIKGDVSPEYGEKMHADSFEFLVDVNTGILMKYESFDVDGNISNYMYTENIKFEDDATDVTAFSKNIIKGYKETEMMFKY